ncbi:DUF1365 domain-containing protein [Streptosporangium minutum]|uniref:DUF1365 domain-containing protein n=1 Tax=Streptosporangium minutum TaxID=569862 RepID=A0A243RMV1_9ACTN|nr:DUF1365 domain-containing protein [Streptosporangium minutum]OUC96187.1 hypothetical protein CA984_15790 [Streptosporangium minutum]
MTGPEPPALYECVITHVRSAPIRNRFGYGSYLWLVDLDRLPENRWLAAFHARDHMGDPGLSIRRNVDAFLAAHGVTARRITMLTNARVLGHVFNPLTVYWCHTGEGVAVVAEVHNTYGGRHRYLLRPGEHEVAKEFHVSPFHPVDGRYRLSLPEPGERLALTVTLHREGQPPFVASVRGRRRPATGPWLYRMAAKHPLAPLVGSARIRRQGIGLYLRGLKTFPPGGPR